jgi:hypothetical protein
LIRNVRDVDWLICWDQGILKVDWRVLRPKWAAALRDERLDFVRGDPGDVTFMPKPTTCGFYERKENHTLDQGVTEVGSGDGDISVMRHHQLSSFFPLKNYV